MKLYRYDLNAASADDVEEVLIGEFISPHAAIAEIRRQRPQARMLSIIPTAADGTLDSTLWVLHCHPTR